jgi:hypothetical protein
MKFITDEIKKVVAATFVFFLLFSLTMILIAQVQKKELSKQSKIAQEFQLTAKIENGNDKFKVGEPIQLTLIIENRSDESLYYLDSCVSLDYKFTVKNESNDEVPLTKEGERLTKRSEVVCRYKMSKLESGKSRQKKINLAHLYDISVKGKYYVSVSRSAQKGESEVIKLESEVIEIIVE